MVTKLCCLCMAPRLHYTARGLVEIYMPLTMFGSSLLRSAATCALPRPSE
jgi:hypothetical protein